MIVTMNPSASTMWCSASHQPASSTQTTFITEAHRAGAKVAAAGDGAPGDDVAAEGGERENGDAERRGATRRADDRELEKHAGEAPGQAREEPAKDEPEDVEHERHSRRYNATERVRGKRRDAIRAIRASRKRRSRSMTRLLTALAMAGAVSAVPFGLAPAFNSSADAASFDCAKASNPTELAICSDPRASTLDSQLGAAFDARVARDPGVRQIERGWLAARNAGCGRDVGCISSFTAAELAWLQSAARRLPNALPTHEGACGLATIRQIGSRLEGAPDSGSAVAESDGAYQVSYDTIPAIQASQIGDAALVCLVSIPRHCAPHDNRGRVYAVANLRTLAAWSAPDAEHMCGGA